SSYVEAVNMVFNAVPPCSILSVPVLASEVSPRNFMPARPRKHGSLKRIIACTSDGEPAQPARRNERNRSLLLIRESSRLTRPMDIAPYYFFMLKGDVHDRSVQYPIPAVPLHRSGPPDSAITGNPWVSRRTAK